MFNEEKIVGILGGMGPYATLDFFSKILSLTKAKKDWEHLHILIDNNVKIPSRTRSILYKEKSPVSEVINSINKLASIGAEFVALPCNSIHYFYKDIVPNIKIPWLNMIEVTSKLVQNKCPLILGGYITIKKKLYSDYIPQAIYLTNKENGLVFETIEEIKLTNNLSKVSKKRLELLVSRYKNYTDTIILACSELPIIFNRGSMSGLPLINPNVEYAKAVIKFAKSL